MSIGSTVIASLAGVRRGSRAAKCSRTMQRRPRLRTA